MEMVAFQKEISSFLPLILGDGQQRTVFGNIIEMIEEVTTRLMDLSQEADKKAAVLNISGIRRILEKNILKVIQKGEGFF